MSDTPEKLGMWIYALVKNASQSSYLEFIDNWGISDEQEDEIEKWFLEQGITLWTPPKKQG